MTHTTILIVYAVLAIAMCAWLSYVMVRTKPREPMVAFLGIASATVIGLATVQTVV